MSFIELTNEIIIQKKFEEILDTSWTKTQLENLDEINYVEWF